MQKRLITLISPIMLKQVTCIHILKQQQLQKVHFVCRSCEKLFAIQENLDFKEPDAPTLPLGFKIQGGEWILYGLCPACPQER